MKTATLFFPIVLCCLIGCAQGTKQQLSAVVKHPVPLRNFFGVNAYEWDFEDPANADRLDTNRLKAIKNFTAVRHYLDWEKLENTEGDYTFYPARNGGWNYDTIYRWCLDQHIDVLACIKTIPKWIENTYPEGQRNGENVPARYGKDKADPASYIEQAKLGFQFAARYGSNKAVDRKLLKVNATPRWTGDHVNTIEAGLSLVKFVECDNERDKWWKGKQAHQSGSEYAANLSAFYDGNKGKMGPGVGVKNADPNMKVVMAGLASPDVRYLQEMIDWSKQHRGYRKDGSIDLPWDIINYHYYCNDANGTDREQTIGVAPELTTTAKIADEFISMAHQYAKDMPVWVTETGYDISPQSTQRAVPPAGRTIMETQADWTLRTSLLYARSGIQKVFYFQLYDDNATSTIKYGTSGLINADRTRRPAADYLFPVNKLFGAYKYDKTISSDPIVDRYIGAGKTMYALVVPDAKGRTATYSLDLGQADSAYIYTPKAGGNDMLLQVKNVTNGKVYITVGETPVFVQVNK